MIEIIGGIWVTLTAIAYAAQISDNAGPGAWMNAAVLALFLLWRRRELTR